MSANRIKIAFPLVIAAAAMLLLLLAAGPAAAYTGYGIGAEFGVPGRGDGQFVDPVGVAVDDASGDVYVVDRENQRVERFSPAGGYEAQFNGGETPTKSFSFPEAIAVDNSGKSVSEDPSVGDVYVADSGHDVVDKFTASGMYEGQLTGVDGVPFAGIAGVAVDPAGNVWVLEQQARPENTENGHVDEFNAEGAYIGGFDDTYEHAHAIAAGTSGSIYLARGPSGEGSVHLWTETGGVWSETEIDGEGSTAIAADPASNDVFVDDGARVAQYGPAGEPLATFGSGGELSASQGIAVNGTSSVYVSQREADTITQFKYGLFADVSTSAASALQRTSAKLEGVVNPDGQQVSSCEFEYGTSTAYGQTAACVPPPGSGSSPVALSAQLAALTPGTTYHYRLAASNATGVNRTADSTLTTAPAVEGVVTGSASEVQGTSATLTGTLEPNGLDTRYAFEYGPCPTLESCKEAAYNNTTASTDAGSGTEEEPVSAAVSSLEGNEAYHFRLVADNSFGKTSGEESTFTTALAPPQIQGQPSASFLNAQSAVLSASLNPEHLATRYHFEYGACPTLAGCATLQRTSDEESSQAGAIATSQEIRGLAPATTYSYRLSASNEYEEAGKTLGGKATSSEGTFTTAPAAALQAATGPASAIATTSALISGAVNPGGEPATYAFELGVYTGAATQYGIVFSGPAGAGATPVEETQSLSGLQPGTTYAYRVKVTSGYGSATGTPALFSTAGLAAVLSSPSPLAQLPIPRIAFPAGTAPHKTTSGKKVKKGTKSKKRRKTSKKKKRPKRRAHKRTATKSTARAQR